jgi:hypothetical protein
MVVCITVNSSTTNTSFVKWLCRSMVYIVSHVTSCYTLDSWDLAVLRSAAQSVCKSLQPCTVVDVLERNCSLISAFGKKNDAWLARDL